MGGCSGREDKGHQTPIPLKKSHNTNGMHIWPFSTPARFRKSRTRHRIIVPSTFNDITNWESQKVPNECPAQAREAATCAARFGPGYWGILWSRIGKDLDMQ